VSTLLMMNEKLGPESLEGKKKFPETFDTFLLLLLPAHLGNNNEIISIDPAPFLSFHSVERNGKGSETHDRN